MRLISLRANDYLILMMESDISKFKKQLDYTVDLLNRCANSDEQLRELTKTSMKIDLGYRANPRAFIGVFCNLIENDYAHAILKSDTAYFMNDFSLDDEDPSLLAKIRSWWASFTKDQQDDIERAVKLLLMRGAIAVKDERLRNIINQYRSEPLQW